MKTDAFALLGLPRRAALSAQEVREAFQKAAAAAHPDGAGDAGERARRTADFAALNEAQAILTSLPRRLRHLFAHTGPSGLAEVESALSRPDPARIPTLDDMARSLDAFYRRFAIDPAAPEAADGAALQKLLAANLDGSIFRQELVRLADEYAQVKTALDGERSRTEAFERQSREWMAKLERDIEALKAELAGEVAQRRDLGQQIVQLQIHKDAFDLLPEIVRKLLLKKILDARN